MIQTDSFLPELLMDAFGYVSFFFLILSLLLEFDLLTLEAMTLYVLNCFKRHEVGLNFSIQHFRIMGLPKCKLI